MLKRNTPMKRRAMRTQEWENQTALVFTCSNSLCMHVNENMTSSFLSTMPSLLSFLRVPPLVYSGHTSFGVTWAS